MIANPYCSVFEVGTIQSLDSNHPWIQLQLNTQIYGRAGENTLQIAILLA